MSKKVIFPLIAVIALAGNMGCKAEAQVGTVEPKAATPPPPPPPPDPPPAATPPPAADPPPPKPVKAFGRAKIEGNEIKIPGKIHFDNNKASIKEDAETKEILKTVADVMKENTQITKLHVEGHTDNVGGDDHNLKLSQERAQSVVDWLAKNGTDKARLEAKGYGEHHPIGPNDTAANKEINRRVEFKLWELEGKPTDAQKNDVAVPAGGAAPAAAGAKDPKAAPAAAGASAKPAATPPKK